MEIEIIPPEGINYEELEQALDQIESNVHEAAQKAHRPIQFSLNWAKNNGEYKLDMQYTGQGFIKNRIMKMMIKKAMKKIDKRIKVK